MLSHNDSAGFAFGVFASWEISSLCWCFEMTALVVQLFDTPLHLSAAGGIYQSDLINGQICIEEIYPLKVYGGELDIKKTNDGRVECDLMHP